MKTNIWFISLLLAALTSCGVTTVYKYNPAGSGVGGNFYILKKKSKNELFIPSYSNLSYYDSVRSLTNDVTGKLEPALYPSTSNSFDIYKGDSNYIFRYTENGADTFYTSKQTSYISNIPFNIRFLQFPRSSTDLFACKYIGDSTVLFDGSVPMKVDIFEIEPFKDAFQETDSSKLLRMAISKEYGIPVFVLGSQFNSTYGIYIPYGAYLSDYKMTYLSRRRIKRLLFL